MPELPEVYTTSNYFKKYEKFKIIKLIDHTSKCAFNFNRFNKSKILFITYYGKKIVFVLEDLSFICIFLRMFGRLSEIRPDEHHHVTIRVKNRGKCHNIYYSDKGGLGMGDVTYCADSLEYESYISSMGLDYISLHLSGMMDFNYWMDKIQLNKRNTNIGLVLLEQNKISGIGNYLRSDILYHSKIHPKRICSTINKSESLNLFNSIIHIIMKSTKKGGMSMRDYLSPDGKPGKYRTICYGRNIDKNGNKIKKDKLGGRVIYYCPSLQSLN